MSVRGNAILSDNGRYRYRLERYDIGWAGGSGAIAWIMVNPSTADATADDPTIKKVIGFSQRAGAAWLIVGNKFAYRATDVRELRSVADPSGPENMKHLEAIIREAPTVVAAWGPLSKLPPQLRRRWLTIALMAEKLGVTLQCLGTAKDGQPLHPLMVGYDQPLRPWSRP